ncbi:MAG: DUF5666 domain-containing protein [Chloroflexota bacterium]|nr:DUF5666 domain-containing protein [Chloroflexota bacterium]
MSRLICLLTMFLVLAGASPVQAQPSSSSHPTARTKPGPVTLRGIAHGVGRHGFTLVTRTRGTVVVTILPATKLIEKGKVGKLALHDGDHVGVHGFVQGRQLRAITVRIYPIKPKPFTVRGSVSAIHGTQLVIDAAGRHFSARVTSQTDIRIGSASALVTQLRVGDRVEARLEPAATGDRAVRVHVFRSKAVLHHVTIHGTVIAVTAASLTVASAAGHDVIGLSQSTTVYVGTAVARRTALIRGGSVTVHACCAGQVLLATSIRVLKVKAAVKLSLLRGRIAAVGTAQLRLSEGSGAVTVSLTKTTRYELGSTPIAQRNLQVGDDVSVRGQRHGPAMVAVRVHVYAASRLPHTIRGTVAAVSRGAMSVDARGKLYTVSLSSGVLVTIASNRSSLTAIHAGDTVRVTGRLTTATTLIATAIIASRRPPKVLTVRGTVVTALPALAVVDSAGARYTIHLARGVQARLRGGPAPAGALFPGVRVTAKGTVVARVLVASSLTVEVTIHVLKGRVVRVAPGRLDVRTTSGLHSITLLSGVVPSDGGHRVSLSALHPGAFVEARGYSVPRQPLRALSVSVQHPHLQFSAVVIGTTPLLTVRTSKGETYQLLLTNASTITAGRVVAQLKPADIPSGERVHVAGVVGTDGRLTVDELRVRLHSVTVRGQIATVSSRDLSVDAASGPVVVQPQSSSEYEQGAHSIQRGDLVVGDDVTVYGYTVAHHRVLLRKLVVHRRLTALEGTVGSFTGQSIILDAPDSPHHVLLSDSTIFTGGTSSDIAVGVTLHVTGYLRGDGVVLATRVRFAKISSQQPASRATRAGGRVVPLASPS